MKRRTDEPTNGRTDEPTNGDGDHTKSVPPTNGERRTAPARFFVVASSNSNPTLHATEFAAFLPTSHQLTHGPIVWTWVNAWERRIVRLKSQNMSGVSVFQRVWGRRELND